MLVYFFVVKSKEVFNVFIMIAEDIFSDCSSIKIFNMV